MNEFINFDNSRRNDQKEVMREIADQKHCPFCPENLEKYHKMPIIQNGKYWTLTENQWPYEKVKNQLLAIYKTHIENIRDIEPSAGEELFQMFKDETIKRNIHGGAVAIRFGNNNKHGSYGNSVLHLHAHLIEPDLESLLPDEKWKMTFGKRNK